MNKTKQKIIINGKAYDAATGLAISESLKQAVKPAATNPVVKQPTKVVRSMNDIKKTPSARKPRVAAQHIKPKTQKSTTLRRDVLKKPSRTHMPASTRPAQKIAQSSQISHFASRKRSSPAILKPSKKSDPELVRQSQTIARAHAEHVVRRQPAKQAISSRIVKEHLLKEQLDKAPSKTQKPVKHVSRLSRRARISSLVVTSLSLLLLGGYLTFINIPNLSIKIAAANAGIDASLPKYQPNGFRINGPISYNNGEVAVKYRQAGGVDAYTLVQRSSDWDPQATLDNYVEPESHDNYQIHSAQGLTVYTYGKKAVWVNGGILNIIEGTAALSSQQVGRIAASM